MTPRLLQYSDLENIYDSPERLGRLAETIATHRDDGTLVVGSGDNVAPSVLGLVENGQQALAFFETIRPDLDTLGNHDFDFGPDATRRLVRESPQEWVSANLYEPADGDDGNTGGEASEGAVTAERPRFAGVSPTAVRRCGDARIGFVGVTDPNSSIPPELSTDDPVDAVESAVDALEPRVDWVVVLAHLDDDQTRAVAEIDGVDAVCGGHVHRACVERVDGTLLTRPGPNGESVWELTFGDPEADADDAAVTAKRHPVADGPVNEAVVTQFEERRAEAGLTDTVAVAENPVSRDRSECFAGTARAGTLVAEAYRWAADAAVGYVDTRAIRDGPPLVGSVTVSDLIGLVPFPGELCVVSLTGTELRALLRETRQPAIDHSSADSAKVWWGQVSGVDVTWDDATDAVRHVTVDGAPVVRDETYEVATNGYVVHSDTEFTTVTPDHVVERKGLQYEAVVEYVRANGVELRRSDRLEVVEIGH